MKSWKILAVVACAFIGISLVGLAVSLSAPFAPPTDEYVYLTGALQAREQTLPDAKLLAAYDYGAYLYPRIMDAWYASFGYYAFKSAALVLLILATGFSAYGLFRLLGIAWVPALLASIVVLMPRFTAGTEIFGVLTFHEAIGRACAVPLFLIGTGLLVRRIAEKKAVWPLFGMFGLLMFLHPVTVMLFAFIALIATGGAQLHQRLPVHKIFMTLIFSGLVFSAAGSYFFVDALPRLQNGIEEAGTSAALYTEAVVFRNAWEFPAASIDWFRHTGMVSAFFLGLLALWYLTPRLRAIRAMYQLPHAATVVYFGASMAISALVLTLLLPGLNLYLMQHYEAPYFFQQWSRLAKFYYLGLFVACVPMLYGAWQWYVAGTWRFKHAALVLIVTAGVLSSSFFFEVAQFVLGYKNYERAYIPQTLSGAPDGITASAYREVCDALAALGATEASEIVSNDFALRYFCRANLYVTQEEGAAYHQMTRADVVWWYETYLAQRTALQSGDIVAVREFAERAGATFVVVPRVERYAFLAHATGVEAIETSRHIIVKVNKDR